jgi:hypothetical protein
VSPPSSGEHVVMATAVGYAQEEVRPFVRSLRKSGYSGAIVLYVDRRLERGFRAEGVASGVTLVRVPRWRPEIVRRMTDTRRSRKAWAAFRVLLWMGMSLIRRLPASWKLRSALQLSVANRLYPPVESRFLRYRHFLRANGYSRILLTDVRDVLFQRDPFVDLPSTGLGVSIEVPAYTLATEPHNAERVRSVYGESILDRIGTNRVSCAGVTYGDRSAMASYLELMVKEIESLSLRKVALDGLDQAMHNVILWSGRLQNVHLLETQRSTVATLHGVLEAEVSISPHGTLLNPDGSEPSIVHQYDRVPGLAPRLLQSLVG